MSDHVPGTMHRDEHGYVIEDYHLCGCHPDPERSAGAAPMDARADVQHAFDALNDAMNKIRDGDSPEGDLLEVHARLDSLLDNAWAATDRTDR